MIRLPLFVGEFVALCMLHVVGGSLESARSIASLAQSSYSSLRECQQPIPLVVAHKILIFFKYLLALSKYLLEI